MTDDSWMNPQTSFSTFNHPPKDGLFFVIERKRRVPVSGNVAFLEQWDTWSEFDTKEARDAALEKLRADTSWHVRGRQRVYRNGNEMPSPDPYEFMDV